MRKALRHKASIVCMTLVCFLALVAGPTLAAVGTQTSQPEKSSSVGEPIALTDQEMTQVQGEVVPIYLLYMSATFIVLNWGWIQNALKVYPWMYQQLKAMGKIPKAYSN